MQSSFIKIAENIDVKPLVEELNSKPALWGEITERQFAPGSPHRDTQSIFIRGPKERTLDAIFNAIETVDYPACFKIESLDNIMTSFCKLVEPKSIGRILIVNLFAGGMIQPHADEGAYADHYDRFHLSLQSEAGNLFYSTHVKDERGLCVHGEMVHMRAGELYCFNHKREHWLHNQSALGRIHLIIDAVAPKYRYERAP